MRAGRAGWNDLRHVPSVVAEGDWQNDPVRARRAILDALRELRLGGCYELNAFIAQIKATNPDFQRPDGNYGTWYLRDAQTGQYLSGFESWEQVEARLIRFIVTGPMFWLGALALGADPDGGVIFRLTRYGAAWLGEPGSQVAGPAKTESLPLPPAEMPHPARLTVSEQFIVNAPLPLPLIDRFRLLRFTEPAGSQSELGKPTQHRITRGSLARARASGVKAETIAAFLRRASGGSLPSRVETALERWDQHGGAVRISRGAVVRVGDASILAALRSDPAVAPLLGDLISAQAVLVGEADLPKLLSALQELGYHVQVD